MGGRSQEALRRRGLRLAWLIVVWDVLEGAIAVTAGVIANSIALIGFGIDSGLEVFTASVVIWQLRRADNRRYTRALKIIAVTFFALAAYVSFESVSDLITQAKPDPSVIGIALSAVATAIMVPVAVMQKRTGKALDNEVLVAQSQETWLSNYLSMSLLVGLSLNAVFGIWWADPLIALLIAVVAAWEGWTTWNEAVQEGRLG